MEAHVCNHPKVRHTVEYHIGDAKPETATVLREFDDLENADNFAQKIIRQTTGRLSWLKIYRSDNESYVCFRWDNPKGESNMTDNTVKLEVDMDPLKEAFDNVALGFKEQGKSIRRLWIYQGIVSAILSADLLWHAFT